MSNKLRQQIKRYRPMLVIAGVCGLVTALTVAQTPNSGAQPVVASQPAGVGSGNLPPRYGSGASGTQPSDRLAQYRREREMRDRERRERSGSTSRPANVTPRSANNSGINPAVSPPQASSNEVRLDAQQMKVANDAELERQAAAARASANRTAAQPSTATRPAASPPTVALPGGPSHNPPVPVTGAPLNNPATPVNPTVLSGPHGVTPISPTPQAAGTNPPGVTVNNTTGQPQLNIKEMWNIAPRDRTYFFTWNNTPLEKVLQDFSEMSGLPIMNMNAIDGPSKTKTITFQSSKLLTYDEALTLLDEILFTMTPPGFWVVHRQNYLQVDQLTEWFRKIPPDHIFSSLEDYKKAKLPLWDVASVMYTPKYRSAELLTARANDFVPLNSTRVTLVPVSAKMEVKGFVYWIERQLMEIVEDDVPGNQGDGRTPKIYSLKYATTADAARLLQSMLPNQAGTGARPRPAPAPPGAPSSPDPGESAASQVEIQENPRLGALFIKASDVNHKLIQEYLEKYIDLATDPRDKAELIPLKHADPGDLIDIIRPLLGERVMQQVPVTARPGMPTPAVPPGTPVPMVPQLTSSSTAILLPVPATKSILAKANPDEMKFIKEYVTMLDVEAPYEKVQLIRLKYGSATGIVNILNSSMGQRQNAYGRQNNNQPQTFHASADPSNDSAIVISGEPKDLEDAKQLVSQLDVDPDEGAIDQLVELQHASPSALAELLSARYGSGSHTRFGSANSSLPKFIPDEASRSLVVVCRKDTWPEIQRVISEVDEKSIVKGISKSYPLKHSSATTIAQLLSQSYNTRTRGRFGDESSNAPTFQADPQSNRVVVTATQEVHDQVTKLIAELDQPGPDAAAELKAIDLVSADAAYVASKLEDLFESSTRNSFSNQGSTKVPVRIVAEPVSNRVLISASPEDFKKAFEQAAIIDKEFAARQIIRKTFVLQHSSSFKVERALQTLFPEAGSSGGRFNRGGSEDSPTSVKIVDTGDSIAISAPKDKMLEIERVINDLDTDPTRDNEIRTYTVKGADSQGTTEIAEHLEELFNGGHGGGNQGGGTTIKFIGQRGGNLLIVSAPSARMKEIDARVQEMVKASAANDMTFAIRHFDVRQATPEDITTMMTPLIMARYGEMESQGRRGGGGVEPQIVPQRTAHRVTVAAPESMMPEIEELIKQFDQPSASSTTRIIALKKAKAEKLAPIIEANVEEKGSSATKIKKTKYRGFNSFDSSDSGISQRSGPEDLQVSPVESSNSLILRGPEDLVAAAEKLAKELDEDSSPEGPVFHVYPLPEGIDSYEMITLIEELIGGGSSSSGSGFDDEDRVVHRAASGNAPPVVVKAAAGNRIIVSCPADKVPIIEELINTQIKLVEEDSKGKQALDSDGHLVPTGRTKSGDITMAYDVKGPVEEIAKQLDQSLVEIFGYFDAPYVKSSTLSKQVIVTGKPQQFKLVKEYLDKIEKDPPRAAMGMLARHVSPEVVGRVVAGLQANSSILVNAKALPVTDKEKSAADAIQKNEILWNTPIPASQPAGSSDSDQPHVQPTALHFIAPAAALAELRQEIAAATITQVTTQPIAAVTTQPARAQPQPAPAMAAPVTAAPKPASAPPATQAVGIAVQNVNPAVAAAAEAATSGKVQIRYDEQQGLIYVVGPVGQVEELQKTIDDAIDQAEKLINEGDEQPIRVFRLEHVDVTIAASILETMFNDKAPAQPAQPGNKGANPAPNAQQNQQNKQNNNNNNNNDEGGSDKGKGKQDKSDSARSRRNRDEGEKADETPGSKKKMGGGDRIRVMPNTRDQSLIVRADRDDFPLIAELILKIDRPADRAPQELKVYRLTKLNAADVEDVLKSVLKIEDRGSRNNLASSGFQNNLGGGGGRGFNNYAAQTQMMEQLQQQMLDLQSGQLEGEGENGKGVKLNPAKEITITSDSTTNTIIVLAPQEGMKLVGNLIETLEKQESPLQIVTIAIKNADAENVATELERIFSGAGAASARTGATGGGRRGAAGGGGLNGGGFNGGGFNGGGLFGGGGNALSNTARMGQELRISSDSRTNTIVVRALPSDVEQIQKIVKLIDVPMVEQVTLYPIEHGNATEMATTLGKIFVTDEKAEGPQATRITADADTNTLVVWAPKAQQMVIEAKVKELESRSEDKGKPRQLQLKVATATAVAEKLRDIFVSKGATKGSQRISIEGDDNSSTLFIIAPKEIYDEISEITQRLDTVTRQDIQVFKLKNAYATDIQQLFTTMVTQQMAMIGKNGMEGMPSVVPDARTNSLIVTGTPTVFLAVQKVLAELDVAPEDSTQPTTAMFGLTKGTATTIAASITALYAGKKFDGGVQPPTAVAEPSSNVVYVYGTKKQIDQVKLTVIDPLEKYTPTIDTVVQDYQIKVKNAKTEEVADTIMKFFTSRAAALTAASYASQAPADRAVTVVPDPSTHLLYITSSDKNRKLIEKILETADAPGMSEAGRTNKVFPLLWANPTYTAQAITTVFGKVGNVSEIEKVNVVAEPSTNSIVVSASPENMTKIEQMVLSLDKQGTAAQTTTKIDIKDADANDVAAALNTIYGTKRTASGSVSALFTVPRGTNQILVTCSQSELPNIKTLVAQLDVPGSRTVPRTIPVAHGSAATLAATLTRMFTDPGLRKTNELPPVIMSDDNTNSLVVRATEVDFGIINELTKKLDIESSIATNVEVIPVSRSMDVKAFAPVLESSVNRGALYTAAQTPGVRAGTIAVAADERVPALILTGSPELFKAAHQILNDLESKRPVQTSQEQKTIILQTGNGISAQDMKRILEQFVSQSRKVNNPGAPPAKK